MSVSRKSKFLLEMLFVLGTDTLLSVPSLRKCVGYGGGWDHASSFVRQMRLIQEQGLLRDGEPRKSDWIPKLTDRGRALVADQLDPKHEWEQAWDGSWRTLTFDIAASERKERQRLDTWLKDMRFGHLQGSLWISARSYRDWGEELESLELDPRSVIFMEGQPLGRLSDELIVERSWDFEEIGLRYREYLEFLEKNQPSEGEGDPAECFVDWFRMESLLWRRVLEVDPLLPRCLHPNGYLGRHAWEAKQAAVEGWKVRLRA
ncbi:PaaX family transcriptional regulator C-terminal domain-containing protein [Pelagicoccus mobilis]|uniref:PaaX family transcriptional regulator n=1 Tax=Pelagicoccus mobilis TaxID=415221 RepID=A0A934VRX9_9BACT|nr:PaaX family transcriptional regulator C-terminal domain-containing protein [Pelagicoccus mobilis]MBK1878435.1 hypothetical protein [Pelagicoccus mobilis]